MKTTSPTSTTSAIALTACLTLLTGIACADAPLKGVLELTVDQAAQVDHIQKEARDAVRPVRGELKREERALRRAKSENDAEAIAKQEKAIEPLRQKLSEIFQNEEGQIREVLTEVQIPKYDEWLKERKEMVGSSRDVKEAKQPEEKQTE